MILNPKRLTHPHDRLPPDYYDSEPDDDTDETGEEQDEEGIQGMVLRGDEDRGSEDG
jgi:hypothetical protein